MRNLFIILITLSFIACNTKYDCLYQKPIDINDGLNVSTLEEHDLDASSDEELVQDPQAHMQELANRLYFSNFIF